MSKNPTMADVARPRLRSLVTTIVVVLISVMIVRDILIRRWTGTPPSPPGTTQQPR
jgi:hypothetical protein